MSWNSTGIGLASNTWYYITLTMDASAHYNVDVYTAGSNHALATSGRSSNAPNTPSGSLLYVGSDNANPTYARNFNGIIDQVWVRKSYDSTFSDTAYYLNQNTPNSFYTTGAQTTAPTNGGGGATPPTGGGSDTGLYRPTTNSTTGLNPSNIPNMYDTSTSTYGSLNNSVVAGTTFRSQTSTATISGFTSHVTTAAKNLTIIAANSMGNDTGSDQGGVSIASVSYTDTSGSTQSSTVFSNTNSTGVYSYTWAVPVGINLNTVSILITNRAVVVPDNVDAPSGHGSYYAGATSETDVYDINIQ